MELPLKLFDKLSKLDEDTTLRTSEAGRLKKLNSLACLKTSILSTEKVYFDTLKSDMLLVLKRSTPVLGIPNCITTPFIRQIYSLDQLLSKRSLTCHSKFSLKRQL